MKTVLIFLLLLAIPAAAGELCVEYGSVLECFPGDLGYPMDTVGFSSQGDPCQAAYGEFVPGFSVSASSTDPHVNQGPLPADGLLYLWLTPFQVASAPAAYGGLGSFQAGFQGDLEVLEYEHLVTESHFWDPTTGHSSFGLPCLDDVPTTLVGSFPGGGTDCSRRLDLGEHQGAVSLRRRETSH